MRLAEELRLARLLRWLGTLALAMALMGCQAAPSAATTALTPPATLDGAPLVYVPAGEFVMGSAILNEHPSHTVRLDAFWIDMYEVTNGLYRPCVEAGACRPPASNGSANYPAYYGDSAHDAFPVNQVSWSDADQYCRWAGKHLPTEAEWEKAARGVDGRAFPWGNTWDDRRVNSLMNGLYDTVAVGSYPEGASPYGALDMAGNVWEWVADWYTDDYYRLAPHDNPPGPASGEAKIVRGGGYGVYDAAMRTSLRREMDPETRATFIGFRCAK